jgi:hypothetical protein
MLRTSTLRIHQKSELVKKQVDNETDIQRIIDRVI